MKHFGMDATCEDTYAPSHLEESSMGACTLSASQHAHCQSVCRRRPGLVFTPVAVEASRVLGPLSLIFLKELGHAQLVTQKAMHTCSSTFQWLRRCNDALIRLVKKVRPPGYLPFPLQIMASI